jgi:hypothetical protein
MVATNFDIKRATFALPQLSVSTDEVKNSANVTSDLGHGAASDTSEASSIALSSTTSDRKTETRNARLASSLVALDEDLL